MAELGESISSYEFAEWVEFEILEAEAERAAIERAKHKGGGNADHDD